MERVVWTRCFVCTFRFIWLTTNNIYIYVLCVRTIQYLEIRNVSVFRTNWVSMLNKRHLNVFKRHTSNTKWQTTKIPHDKSAQLTGYICTRAFIRIDSIRFTNKQTIEEFFKLCSSGLDFAIALEAFISISLIKWLQQKESETAEINFLSVCLILFSRLIVHFLCSSFSASKFCLFYSN